jgi:hypothetical protein
MCFYFNRISIQPTSIVPTITCYPGAALVSTHDIEAGEELFFHQNAYYWYLNSQDQEIHRARALTKNRTPSKP